MTSPILPVSSPSLAEISRSAGETGGRGAFQQALSAAIRSVQASGQNAAGSVERFLSGEGEELHTTILEVQRAELAFELFQQARNKVVNAYQEIMRMQM